MEAFEFLRNRQLLSPDQSLHETAMPNYTWGDLIQLLDDYLKANSSQLEPPVMQKIADIAEKALTQWKLHIEENEQTDLEDINHLESLEWKKLNAELQSIKSNFSV